MLSTLPKPSNEFVIVLPEEENETSQEESDDWVEDASEVDSLCFVPFLHDCRKKKNKYPKLSLLMYCRVLLCDITNDC